MNVKFILVILCGLSAVITGIILTINRTDKVTDETLTIESPSIERFPEDSAGITEHIVTSVNIVQRGSQVTLTKPDGLVIAFLEWQYLKDGTWISLDYFDETYDIAPGFLESHGRQLRAIVDLLDKSGHVYDAVQSNTLDIFSFSED